VHVVGGVLGGGVGGGVLRSSDSLSFGQKYFLFFFFCMWR